MQNKYDAIVVGTGISGGWAAKELTEKGLKTLVLERGRMITHVDDYHTADMDPWDFEGGDTITQDALQRQPKQAEQDMLILSLLDTSLLMTLIIHITTMKTNLIG